MVLDKDKQKKLLNTYGVSSKEELSQKLKAGPSLGMQEDLRGIANYDQQQKKEASNIDIQPTEPVTEAPAISGKVGGMNIMSDGTNQIAEGSGIKQYNSIQGDKNGNSTISKVEGNNQFKDIPQVQSEIEKPTAETVEEVAEETVDNSKSFFEWQQSGKNPYDLVDLIEQKYGGQADYNPKTNTITGIGPDGNQSVWSFDAGGNPIRKESPQQISGDDLKSQFSGILSQTGLNTKSPEMRKFLTDNKDFAKSNQNELKNIYLEALDNKKLQEQVDKYSSMSSEQIYASIMNGDLSEGSNIYKAVMQTESGLGIQSIIKEKQTEVILKGEGDLVPSAYKIVTPQEHYDIINQNRPDASLAFRQEVIENPKRKESEEKLYEGEKEIARLQTELNNLEAEILNESPNITRSELARRLRKEGNAIQKDLDLAINMYNVDTQSFNRANSDAVATYEARMYDEELNSTDWNSALTKYYQDVDNYNAIQFDKIEHEQQVELMGMQYTSQENQEIIKGEYAVEEAVKKQEEISRGDLAKQEEISRGNLEKQKEISRGDLAVTEKEYSVKKSIAEMENKNKLTAIDRQRDADELLYKAKADVDAKKGILETDKNGNLYYISNDGYEKRLVAREGENQDGTYSSVSTNSAGEYETTVYDITGKSHKLTTDNTGLSARGLEIFNVADQDWIQGKMKAQYPDLPEGMQCAEWVNNVFGYDTSLKMGSYLTEKLAVAGEKTGKLGSIAVWDPASTGMDGYGHVGIIVGDKDGQFLIKSSNAKMKGMISTEWVDKSKILGYKSTPMTGKMNQLLQVEEGSESEGLETYNLATREGAMNARAFVLGTGGEGANSEQKASINSQLNESGIREKVKWIPNSSFYDLKQSDQDAVRQSVTVKKKLDQMEKLISEVETGSIETRFSKLMLGIGAIGEDIPVVGKIVETFNRGLYGLPADEQLQKYNDLEQMFLTNFGAYLKELSGAAVSDMEREFYKPLAGDINAGDLTSRQLIKSLRADFNMVTNTVYADHFGKPGDTAYEGEMNELNTVIFERGGTYFDKSKMPAEDLRLIDEVFGKPSGEPAIFGNSQSQSGGSETIGDIISDSPQSEVDELFNI